MATEFNTQVGGGVYRLQFETDNRAYYDLMQEVARRCVDGKPIPEQYGNFLWCMESDVEGAKELLLENLIDSISELAKKDDFWIVGHGRDHLTNPLFFMGCPFEDLENACTVGWKIGIFQMGGGDEK